MNGPAPGGGKALIFDMDGVLLDSHSTHCQAWIAYNRTFGLETTEEMLLRGMHGKRNDDIVRFFFGPGLSQEEVLWRGAEKEKLYREMMGSKLEQMLVPGLRPFLERYTEWPLAVATNAEPENVSFLLNRARLRDFFRVVVDGSQVERPKPDPEIYLRAAALLGVAPEKSIVFEDSHSGVEAALAAGMRVIGVSTTYVNLPGATITVDNFLSRELYSWLADELRVS